MSDTVTTPPMSDTVMTYERAQAAVTAEIYVPVAAAETETVGDRTVMDVLKRRAADHFGGYTVTDGTGGWMNGDRDLIEEEVKILKVHVPRSSEVDAETFTKVNLGWLFHETDESEVMGLVDDQLMTVGVTHD